MKVLFIVGSFTILLLSSASWGMERCTKAVLGEIEGGPFIFEDWPALYKSYSKYGVCDDGNDVSEGYSESVARLLADHWDKLPELVALSSKHRRFKTFVLRHVNATVYYDDLKKISQLSKTQCPITSHALCVVIGSQSDAAIKESNEVLQKSGS